MALKVSFAEIRHEGCEHCIHNPNATKPYIEMKKLDLDKETLELYKKAADMLGLKINCLMCVALHDLMAMPEKDLVKLLMNMQNR